MTENSPLIGSQPGADILRGASATHSDASVLQKAASGSNFGLTDASIWRMSDEISATRSKPRSRRSPCSRASRS
jgi:hypothetical protein